MSDRAAVAIRVEVAEAVAAAEAATAASAARLALTVSAKALARVAQNQRNSKAPARQPMAASRRTRSGMRPASRPVTVVRVKPRHPPVRKAYFIESGSG